MRVIFCCFVVLLSIITICRGQSSLSDNFPAEIYQNWFPKAPLLPVAPGEVLKVKSVEELYNAVELIKPGGTIILGNGHYQMPKSLVIETENVTLRSESGERTKVVLDFMISRHGEGVVINSKSGFTLVSLTIQNVKTNGIKINSNFGVDKVTIYDVVSRNVWIRHIKGPRVPDNEDGTPSWVEDCRIQYCIFYNDHAKKNQDDGFNGNYIGGIDIMNAKNWVISDNVFLNIRGFSGAARGGIFLWYNGMNCIVERNIFIGCDSGICLGNSHGRDEERRHCNGFIVRNNFITRINANEGIFVGHTRDCQILNNTIHNQGSGRLIRIAHANDGLLVAGNIFSGSSGGVSIDDRENTGPVDFRDNFHKTIPEAFVNPDKGNLHLKPSATDLIDKGPLIDRVREDINRHARDPKPDFGAHEFIHGLKDE